MGDRRLENVLMERAFGDDALFNRLLEARDLVEKFGNRAAIELILHVAQDSNADPDDRLQTLDVLNTLGYRQLPRVVIDEISSHCEIDDYWLGDFLLRLGRNREALDCFRKAVSTRPKEYREQIVEGLATLLAEEDVVALLGAESI